MDEEQLETEEESDISGEKQKVKMGGGASNFRPWLFQKGKSGNPKGRPKGSKSMKQFVKEYLEQLSDEDKIEFMEGLPKDILWRMAEVQPHQTSETDVKGKIVLEFAPEFNKIKNEVKPAPETKPDNTVKREIQDNKGGPQGGQDKV